MAVTLGVTAWCLMMAGQKEVRKMIKRIFHEITEIRKELTGIRKELQTINYNLKLRSEIRLDGKTISQAVLKAIRDSD